ncbi:MAG TPA: sigma-54 dependent transcriptional regulator [Pirellulaceae bacterium]|nr:sigma-54 dependent transcriptional regulator [Pirellulaceae bacterium]
MNHSLEPRGASILVVDDLAHARESIADALRSFAGEVVAVSGAAEALSRVAARSFDVILSDLNMPGMDGLALVGRLKEIGVRTPIVMLTGYASIPTAVEAMRLGAFDYLEKPFDVERLERTVERALRAGQALALPSGSALANEPPRAASAMLLGESPPAKRLREEILRVAATEATVLIQGESGVGKELVARALHAASGRAAGPIVGVNCPALSPQLMESELFGHEKGAFTHAETRRIGRFEAAQGGTIFLDEITELEIGLQAKLLRVLQERSFERVGSSEPIQADVRVIAATNRDARQAIVDGRLREDLYYRLAVVPLCVPPLRERIEDVPALAELFLDRAAERTGLSRRTLSDGALQLTLAYDWPGNVRELENLIVRAAALSPSETISPDLIRPWLSGRSSRSTPASAAAGARAVASSRPSVVAEAESPTLAFRPGSSLEQVERSMIAATLDLYGGHRAKTAEALGIGVRTLTDKIKRYGLNPRSEASFSRAACAPAA